MLLARRPAGRRAGRPVRRARRGPAVVASAGRRDDRLGPSGPGVRARARAARAGLERQKTATFHNEILRSLHDSGCVSGWQLSSW